MKTTLFSALMALFCLGLYAQQPTIEGDLLLCPEGTGTATIVTDQAYDSYQWQWRFSFGDEEFQDVPGATSSEFTYDHYNYSVTDIRVRVTLEGQTYYSNELAIDGYAFLPIFTMQNFDEEEVSIDPNNGTLLLCEGGSIEFSVGMPYTSSIQWYKNDVAMNGETNPTLIVMGPGNYHVTAAPQACPGFFDTSLPVSVAMDPDCSLSIGTPVAGIGFGFYPNPVRSTLHFNASSTVSTVEIFDVSGKKLLSGSPAVTSGDFDTSALSSGVYVMKVGTAKGTKAFRLVKE
ncbi:T9SS type A sorting domain-containing protein [Flavobacterium selenitireducens]|uniref:T9SS type A sorting domain-containing protein n=1 Tax=Flavobacterium selenitireducens TaxID=2722704 RepID=UPI00168B3D63|nr:T9SS type A sorting domain-containing protein [Flavobacterium selenitireducens]MBD3583856.1 T9SS type A sorting domain-containing protein [Flavobacterium selenitireducens]